MTLQIMIGILIRHCITLIGGGTFVDGLAQGDTVNQIAGVIAALAGVGLSALDKKK